MTFKQLKKFTKKVNYGSPIPIFILYDKEFPWAVGTATFDNEITITKQYWQKYKCVPGAQTEYKAFILHEAGHLYTRFGIRSKAQRELRAQIWAIERAKELNLKAAEKYLKKELRLWKAYKWNKQGCFRRYILAGKLYNNPPYL